jgi:hypothetical protein
MARPEITGQKVHVGDEEIGLASNQTEPKTKKKKGGKRAKDPNRVRFADEESESASIATFCRRHSISVAKYYELKAAGRGPVESLVDGRIIITKENQEAWRRSLPVRGPRHSPMLPERRETTCPK